MSATDWFDYRYMNQYYDDGETIVRYSDCRAFKTVTLYDDRRKCYLMIMRNARFILNFFAHNMGFTIVPWGKQEHCFSSVFGPRTFTYVANYPVDEPNYKVLLAEDGLFTVSPPI